MLSKRTKKLLSWISKRDRWMYRHEIQANCPVFDDRAFQSLVVGSFLDRADWDTDRRGGGQKQFLYRISDKGLAYLELDSIDSWKEARAWITATVAVLSFVMSLLALLPK